MARYNLATGGTTDHAEAVEITNDPEKISYAPILQVSFSVAHDPTRFNWQGPDMGAHYRPAIFPVCSDGPAPMLGRPVGRSRLFVADAQRTLGKVLRRMKLCSTCQGCLKAQAANEIND